MSIAAGDGAGGRPARAQVGPAADRERARGPLPRTTWWGRRSGRAGVCLPSVLHFYLVCNRSLAREHCAEPVSASDAVCH